MEKVFSGPRVIAERMGGTFDVAAIAASDEEEFVARARPAGHPPLPGSMAKRVRQACQVLVERYDGQAANVRRDQPTGAAAKAALAKLPGFGPDKAAIFTAVLGSGAASPRRAGRRRPGTTANRTRSARSPTSWTWTRWPGSGRPSSRPRRPPRRPR